MTRPVELAVKLARYRRAGLAFVAPTLRTAVWRRRLRHLGEGAYVHPLVRITMPREVSIGRRASVNSFVHMWSEGGITIGDETMIASHAVITSATHELDALPRGIPYRDTLRTAPVRIGRNVWIGSGAIVLPGVTIGDDAVVAAGAVVTRDVEPATLVMGVPARPVRRLGG